MSPASSMSPAGASRTTTSEDLAPDRRRWRSLAVCLSATFVSILDVSIVTVALPSIGRGLSADPSSLQWVVSGYALGFGMVPIIAGRLGDDLGRKRMLLIGIAGFVITSAVSGFAPTMALLIIGRILQGISAGFINPQVSGLVQQLFPAAERGRAFGMLGLSIATGTAAGPLLGGLLIAAGGPHLGWRLVFLINVPIVSVSWLLCLLWLPGRTGHTPPRRLDIPGAALLTVAVFCVVFPAVQYDAHHDNRLFLFGIAGMAFFVAFSAWERGPGSRRGHPLIDVTLFRVRSFTTGLVVALFYFTAYGAVPLMLALYLQYGLGFSALQSGCVSVAFALGVAVSSQIGGRAVTRFGPAVVATGLAVFAAGLALVALVALVEGNRGSHLEHAAVLALPLLVLGLGGGLVVAPNQTTTLAEVRIEGGSTAGGMLQTAQRIGQAIGPAAASALFYLVSLSYTGHGRPDVAYPRAFAADLALMALSVAVAFMFAWRDVLRGRRPFGRPVTQMVDAT